MQVDQEDPEKLNAITHSPYYGCTVRVQSKARVSYEGVLDGISTNKDRIFLKNVRINTNVTGSPEQNHRKDDSNRNSTSDTLNEVMIDHLTNDIRTYEQVCLNVRDIQELKLIQLPSTFHESKAKLRAIDPCLVDIRLSPSDEYETRSNGSANDHPPRAPIARQKRSDSFGSNGGSALISSSSNESSSSFGFPSREKFADESNDESIDEQIEKFSQLRATSSLPKPVTLLAKKILPKKIERRPDAPLPPTATTLPINSNHNQRQPGSDCTETGDGSARPNNSHLSKKGLMDNPKRTASPIRVTITSKLNPDAIPFYTQQRNVPAIPKSSFTFYERPRFRPRLQPLISPDRSQSLPYGINIINSNPQQQLVPPPPPPSRNHHHSHQRFVPPRQIAIKKDFKPNNLARTNSRPVRTPPPAVKYRVHPSSTLNKQLYPQRQQQRQYNQKTSTTMPGPVVSIRHGSLPTPNILIQTPPMQDGYHMTRNNPARRSTASIHSTVSLPYHHGSPIDRTQLSASMSYGETMDSRRMQRTTSGASSCSSVSLDIGPHSIVQHESSSSNGLPSFKEQYDFAKANEEFRRYLELEELVTRRTSSHCSVGSCADDPEGHSYKKEISFFDRISCTATTGTAVGYTEMDETEKNLETFGDDALRLASNSNDIEWQI